MEAKAICRNLRMAPRKVRLVADLVRGMKVNDALVQLQFNQKRAATPVSKLVRSAVANFKQMEGAAEVDLDQLVIRTIQVDEGPTARRFLPRAMGRATMIRKRSSHIKLTVGPKDDTPTNGAEE
jgi:large subunit ribosomal protein L22